MHSVYVDGDPLEDLYEDDDGASVSIQFGGREDGIPCPDCGAPISDYGGQWEGHEDDCPRRWPFVVVHAGSEEVEQGFSTEEEAERFGNEESIRFPSGWDVEERATGPDPEQELAPESWCNGAGVEIKADSVDVWISLGDPRGAFVMRAERMRYTDHDGRKVDEIRLSVPHPSAGWLHLPLTPLGSEGHYKVGN